MSEQIDLTKQFKHLYSPSTKEPSIVDVPSFNLLMLDGHGNPNTSPEYVEVLEALYSLAYTMKFAMKKSTGIDFKVMPLEGLWWVQGAQSDQAEFVKQDKDSWYWTMMILQPPVVTAEWVETARQQAQAKKDAPTRIAQIRFEKYHEGLSVQLMHLGPYSEEGPNIARMHAFALGQGYHLEGKHHEIYLGDPRRTAPEKLRTVIRQPIAK